jgi:peptidoglycan-associated lipoprotein
MRKTSLMLAILTAALASGCATEKYVKEQIAPVSQRVDDLGNTSLRLDTSLKQTNDKLGQFIEQLQKNDADTAEASKTAQEALERAEAAGKLAEGKLVYEMTMSDSVAFKFGTSELTDEAKAALDQFAEKLKTENRNVYIEIQGHTDSTGPEAYNLKLGEDRANAVQRYLAIKGGIPLHRMSSISYGETEPVADNKTRDGRAQNRRVVLVVLN